MKFYKLVLAVFIFLFTIPSYAFAQNPTPTSSNSSIYGPNTPCSSVTALKTDGNNKFTPFDIATQKVALKQPLHLVVGIPGAGTVDLKDSTLLLVYRWGTDKFAFAGKGNKIRNGLLDVQVAFEHIPSENRVYVVADIVKGLSRLSGSEQGAVCSFPIAGVERVGSPADTCIPGGTRPEDQNCGKIETALGAFSGNPGVLARGLLNLGLGIAGGVALLIMIFAGYKLITSRGNPDAIQSGRDLFTAAIIGLLVVIFSAFIIRMIGTTLKIPGISLVPTVSAASFGGFPLDDPTKFANKSVGDIFTDAIPIVFFFAGILAFGFLIFGGFKYMVSRGDPKALDSAKSAIAGAIKGLLIILLSYLILLIIQAVLKIRIAQIPNTASADVNLGQALNTPVNSFGELMSSLILVVLPLAGIIFFFLLLWGGIKYMLSRGDDKAVSSARGIITSALVGLLIIVGSFLIIKIVEGITNIRIL